MNANDAQSFADKLETWFSGQQLVLATLVGPRSRQEASPSKVTVKPVLAQNERKYQFAYQIGRKVTHRNLGASEARIELQKLLSEQFKQANVRTMQGDMVITLNKRREATVRALPVPVSPNAAQHSDAIPLELRHDRVKNHLLPEGEVFPFLVRLGVMTQEGRVIAAKRDKFRQINRFLEMVADVAPALAPDRPLQIVDFGCGKAYLTFALYHYLRVMRGLDVSLIGVDLKADVMAYCNDLARELGYADLSFVVGDIANFDPAQTPTPDSEQNSEQTDPACLLPSSVPFSLSSSFAADMVVALHACDTATDDALARAVAWGVQIILAVPCCQHELFHQIENDTLRPMLRHGIIRERLASLVTDSLRAELLETQGYTVQLLEFVETEHTPKNLLIRAVKRNALDPARAARAQEEYARFRDFWHIVPSLEQRFMVPSEP